MQNKSTAIAAPSINNVVFLLKLVFFFSGFASLMYQVVWQRLLTTYYGVGAISVTLIVSVYMCGLGFGALLGGFLAERVKAKITLYFLVELFLGLFGLASLPILDVLGRATAGSNYIVSLCCMFLFLCIPTILMGTTLPLLTKIYNRLVYNFLESISTLYFINTLGAALGAVFASYIVISFFGLDTGIYVAATINFILAVLIFTARNLPEAIETRTCTDETIQPPAEGLGNLAYLLVLITGFLAIGYEIIWFRVIGVLVKESAYAFSTVLSVYLTGIALGSFGIERYLAQKKSISRKNLFFLLQWCIGAYGIVVIIGYCYATQYTPFGFLTRLSFSQHTHPSFDLLLSPWNNGFLLSKKQLFVEIYSLVDVFFWPSLFVLIPTVLMGASFPLLSSLALTQQNKEGRTVGTVYFFNILGNVLGGIITGFLLLPILNTEPTLLCFGITGLLFFIFISDKSTTRLLTICRVVGTICIILAALVYFPAKGQLYKIMHNVSDPSVTCSEGVDGLILTHHNNDQNSMFRTLLYINGSFHGFLPGYYFYAGAIELFSYAPRPKNVLIIGYGIGTLTDAVLQSREVKKVTLVELSSTLIQHLKGLPFCARTLADERLELVIDDGRRYLLTTPEKFDLIIMDPLKTTWAYSNNLYSMEFFKLAQTHLAQGGILCIFMGGKEIMAKTLISVFKYVRDYDGGFFAADTPFTKSDFRVERYLSTFPAPDRDIIARMYKKINCVAEQTTLQQKTSGFPANRDLKPILEYYLGQQVKEKFSWYK